MQSRDLAAERHQEATKQSQLLAKEVLAVHGFVPC